MLADPGVTPTATIDEGLRDLIVSWLDVDHQPAGWLIAELAAGVDGVLWSATHASTGPYLWIENSPAARRSKTWRKSTAS